MSPAHGATGALGRLHLCSPSHRMVAPTLPGRRLGAPSIAGSSCSSPRSARPGSPERRASNARARSRRVPAKAKRRHRIPRHRGREQEAGERRHGAHRFLADRRERQARHVELDLQPQPARPRARGLRQPGQRCPRRRRRRVRQHDGPRRAGPGLPDGLLPGPRRSPDRCRRTSCPPRSQAAPVVAPGIGTVTCPWSPTLTLNITKDWLPGCYLLKLVGDGGEEQFVPLTIRDDASTAAYVLQNSVTTWQAYNLWGSYSLYYGPDKSGRSDLRQPRPRRVLRPALPADVGLRRGRLRRQRAAAAVPSREPRPGHDLLDRRRPARPAAAADEPPLPLQPGPRRVLVPADAPGRGNGQRRRRQPRLPRGQRLLPPDPPAADLGRPQPPAGLLQGRRRGPDRPPAAGSSPPSTGTRRRSTSPSRPSSARCTSRSGPRPTWS